MSDHAKYSPRRFHPQAEAALADPVLRQNFRGAMDYLRAKRRDAFADPQEEAAVRDAAEQIRQRCLSRLPDLLEQLEANCERNGIKVHWAQTPAEANAIILGIAQQHGVSSIVKGKSMVSEEVGFNHEMARHGIRCLESDMGEFIVQLDGDTPSHIIMPAIHKNKQEVSDTFASNLEGFTPTTDVDALIQTGRRALREEFRRAGMGLSGVNFAVAETGSLCLVENEGNGRMCTTVPKVHVAITGIEKVVECLSDVPPLYSALTRSATGQAITTYFNVISGPRRTGELDGPDEVHLVLLDNGRSQAYRDEELRKTLQCIRCGACMNHCPVYTRIGGHAYGTIYPGPIGKIISPHLAGAGEHERSGDRIEPVRCLRRGVPGAHPHSRHVAAPASGGQARRTARPRTAGGAGGGQKPARDPRHAGLCLCRHPPAPLPRRNRGGRSLAGLDAQTPGPWTQCREAPKPAPQTPARPVAPEEEGVLRCRAKRPY